jgi:hypothetical protein
MLTTGHASRRLIAALALAAAIAPPSLAGGRSEPHTLADLAGPYHFVSFTHPLVGGSGEAAMRGGTLTFDGAGRYSLEIEYDTTGSGGASMGEYDIAPTGKLRLGNALPFGLVADGADVLVVPAISASPSDPAGFLVAVRAGIVLPSLSGRYHLVKVSHNADFDHEAFEFDVEAGFVDFDSRGLYAVHVEYPPEAVGTGNGAYEILSDGRISLDGELPPGMISPEGELIVLPSLDDDDRTLHFLTRAGALPALADLAGRWYGFDFFHDVPVVDDVEVSASEGPFDLDALGRFFARTTFEAGVGPVEEIDRGTLAIGPDGRAIAEGGPGYILVNLAAGLVIAPQFAPESEERGISILARAPQFCASGTVNLGLGEIADVLFVNGSSGGANRTVSVATGEAIELSMIAAPGGSDPGVYVVWGWPPASARCVDLIAAGQFVGCTLYPTPLTAALGPQPVLCLQSPILPAGVCGTARRVIGPATVPFTLRDGNGRLAPIDLLLQGIVPDRGAANRLGFSVTNALRLRVTAGG